MSSQPPKNSFQSILDTLTTIFESLFDAARQGNWSEFLLRIAAVVISAGSAIVGILIFLKVDIQPIYVVAWLATLCLLLLGFIILKLLESFHLGKRLKRFLSISLLSLIVCLAIFIFSPGILSGEGSAKDFVANVKKEKYGVTECKPAPNPKDCLSWGEDILIEKEFSVRKDNNTSIQPSPVWQGFDAKCLDNWSSKEDAAKAYSSGKFSKAAKGFKDFVDASCPNDPEARIYQNNAEAQSSSNRIYRIVVSVPISRKNGEGGLDSQEILRGVELAQYKINEEEILSNSTKLVVGILDDGPFEDTIERERGAAKVAAKKIKENLFIPLGVVGHFSSDATEEASKEYEGKLVSISPTSTAVRCDSESAQQACISQAQVKLSSYVFRTSPSDRISAKTLADYHADTVGGNVAVVYQGDSIYSNSFKEAFREAYDKTNSQVINPKIDSDEKDPCNIWGKGNSRTSRACLDYAQNKDAKALLLVPRNKDVGKLLGKDGILTLNSMHQEYSFALLGSDSMYDQSFFKPLAERMVVSVPWLRSPDYNEYPIEKMARGRYLIGVGGDPAKISWRTAMSYDATYALAEGIAKASNFSCWKERLNPLNPDAQLKCIRSNLKSVLTSDFSSQGSTDEDDAHTVRFNDGDRESDSSLAQLCKSTASGYGFLEVDDSPKCDR